jgi:hypothetical protein
MKKTNTLNKHYKPTPPQKPRTTHTPKDEENKDTQ